VVPTSDIEKTWNLTHIENSHLVRYSNNETFLASLDNPFTSLLFRKAFAYSFDYQTYIDETYNGVMARMGEGIIPFGMVGHQDQLREKKFIPDFDLIQAKTLFQEVGWRGNITFRLGKIPVPEVINAYNIIKADIESLNVGININIMNVNDLNNSQALDRLNSPMYVMGWSADYNDPYNMVFAMLHSNGDYAGYVNYRNPELDQLIDQTEYESDFDTRMALFKQIEELTAKDYANIYTVYKKRAYIVKDWLTNIEESGSLDPMSSYLKFQYISKGKTSTTSTGNKIYY
jgi:ABC-type transport system substrate-binding protein